MFGGSSEEEEEDADHVDGTDAMDDRLPGEGSPEEDHGVVSDKETEVQLHCTHKRSIVSTCMAQV